MRTVIIGAGGISYPHASALIKLGIEITGVYDISAENAKKLAEYCNSKAIDSLDEALERVDCVHLLTPPSKRVEYAIKAMEAGKHVLCEKPIASSIEDAKAMLECADQKGVIFMMAFNMRFRRGFVQLAKLVESGRLGDPVTVFSYRHGAGAGFGGKALSASWRTDPALACGISVESLSHDIDLIRALSGDFDSISAVTHASVPSLPMFDNSAGVSFTMKNGAIGQIDASWASHIGKSARGYIGSKGSAILAGSGQWDFAELRYKTNDNPYEQVEYIGDYFESTDSYYEENKHFMSCVETGAQPDTKGADGLAALRVSLAILQSAKDNSAIKL